jgi:hypothetical protein
VQTLSSNPSTTHKKDFLQGIGSSNCAGWLGKSEIHSEGCEEGQVAQVVEALSSISSTIKGGGAGYEEGQAGNSVAGADKISSPSGKSQFCS